MMSELSANVALPPVARFAVALLTKTRKRNARGGIVSCFNIIVPQQNGTIKVVSRRPGNISGGKE